MGRPGVAAVHARANLPAMTQGSSWWQGAVIYQIYPRSFKDTSADGVGDLEGIVAALDHVVDLGVDALWISPFQKSPMRDFGYDVEDYLAVDPLFGTVDDVKQIIAEAHKRGLKVLMDQVLSHTSDQHPWFRESRASRTNARADWYVWADPKADGTAPSNWLSLFGGPSWQWEPRRGQYYLHNFLGSQPDLNFHNPEVQDALLDMCRFWFDIGVDGFRLDACTFYFHDRLLTDNPPAVDREPPGLLRFNPYTLQAHIHDVDQPETLGFMARLRTLAESYDGRVLLGELNQIDGVRLHKAYTAPGRLQLAYGFFLLNAEHVDGAVLGDLVAELGDHPGDGWPCWALDNHDVMRAVSRLRQGAHHPGFTITLLAALSCLRGALCLYQGSELALPQAEVPFERLRDPYGREFYPAYQGRDGARTPMPWQADAPHCGFSSVEPWLPIPDAHRQMAVSQQLREPGSPLNRLRRFLAWRRTQPALRGTYEKIHAADGGLLVVERRSYETHQDGVLCLFNLADEIREVPLADLPMGEDLTGHGFGGLRLEHTLQLPPWSAHFTALT